MLYFYLPELNFLLALGGLAMLAAAVVLLIDFFFHGRLLGDRLKPFLWPLIFLTTGSSIALSLLYSEYFGFVPCSLCWLQRIAIYPQVLLAVIAYTFKDEKNFPVYASALSVFGLLAASYHYIYQMIPRDKIAGGVLPCLADGTADCADKIINEFDFVTFPLISAFTFIFLISLYLHVRRRAAVS